MLRVERPSSVSPGHGSDRGLFRFARFHFSFYSLYIRKPIVLLNRATSAAAYQTGQAGYAVTPAATAATYTQRPAAAAATGYETYQAAAAAAATGTTYAGKFLF